MIVERTKFLAALNLVKPALASKDTIPELTHIWFDGEYLIASNELSLGIRVPFKSDVKGGVKGDSLVGLVSNFKVKEVEIVAEEESMLIRNTSGKGTKIKLPLIPIDKMLAEIPNTAKGVRYIPKVELLGAFGRVLVSADPNSAMPEQAGITMISTGRVVHIFAMDSETISWVSFKQEMPEGRTTIPVPFIKQLLDLSKGIPIEICSRKTSIYALNERGLVYSPLLGVEEPQDMVGKVGEITKDVVYVNIPARLKLALARSTVLISKQEPKIKLTAKGKVLRILTTTQQGELKDNVALEKDVPESELSVEPKYIKRCLTYCDKIAFAERTIIMQGKNYLYLIFGA